MKKILVFTVISLLSIMIILPASAKEGNGDKSFWKEKIQTMKENFKNRIGQKRDKKEKPEWSTDKDALVLRGSLLAVGNDYVTVKSEPINVERESKNLEKVFVSGEYTAQITENTKIVRQFNGTSTLAEFNVGDKVHIVMKKENDVYVAYLLKDMSIFHPKRYMKATVESVDSDNNTLTVNRGKKSAVVTVDTDTKIQVEGQTATITDIKAGDKVAVKGVVNRNLKTVFADIISVFTGKWNAWRK